MKATRWEKIETICQEALRLTGEKRATYIRNACKNDASLQQKVVNLLAYENTELFDEPLIQFQISFLFSDDEIVADQMMGPYRLIQMIGSGGMGQVYLAVRNDDEFERFVALKVIREGSVSEDALSRFYSERQILASLNHPNIGRLFDGGTTKEGLPWFAMEYVEGTVITVYCNDRKLSVEDRLNLFLKVCSAVHYAHQNLVVHRDLKPANILITEAGEPKLLDFGIAKLIDFDQEPGVTRYQHRLLTPEYASPEQVRQESISTASDVYSLGVLLYEVLTDNFPYQFDKRTPATIERTVCNTIPLNPSTHPGKKHLKGDLDTIILKALKKDPAERYSSVEQFAEDIRRYQKSLPVLAKKDSFSYRSQKFIRRHAWSVSATSLIIALVFIFAVVTYRQSKVIEQRAVEAETERDRAEEVSNFLIDLFASVDPSAARDESLTAIELLHRGADEVKTELSDQPDLQANLFLVISDVYESLGLYDEGIEMAENALVLQQELYGKENAEVATSLNAIGWLYHEKGDFEKADSLLQYALDLRYNLFGKEHLDVARTLNDLAVLKQSQGDFAATDTLLFQSLNIRQKLLGEDHESVGITLSNYAALQYVMGDIDGAIASMDEVLRNFKINFGEKHLRIAVALTNLGAFLSVQGDLEKAEAAYRDALQMRYELVGEEHPSIAYSLVHLGNLLRKKKEYDEAEQLILTSLNLRRKLLGEDHLTVGHSYRALGSLYDEKGEYEKAEKNYLLALKTFRNVFPDGHTDSANVLHLLGDVYLKMNDPIRAEPVFREAMETRMRFYSEGDTRIAESMIKLGICLVERGEKTESKEFLNTGITMINNSGKKIYNLKDMAEKALARL